MNEHLAGPVRLALVEDHVRYREALEATIAAIAEVDLAWISGDADDAIARMIEDPVDLAIVDLSIPGGTGISLIQRIRGFWPDTVCVVLSGHSELAYVRRSLDAGALGYVLKGRPAELREGISAARDGRRYLSPGLVTDEFHV